MSFSFCPSAVCCYVVVPCLCHSVHLLSYLSCHALCHFHFFHQLSSVMLLSHVCATQSICCLTCNAMPHVCFTLSISCLLLCCCSMLVPLGPFAVLLVMPCPMSFSFCPSAVFCYFVVPCLCHSVHLLPYLKCHAPCPFHLSICCLLLFCCSMLVPLGPFAVLLVMPCPMSFSFCPSAFFCYFGVPCLWHLIHLLPYSKCHALCPFHFVHQPSAVTLLFHVCGTRSICCLTCNL